MAAKVVCSAEKVSRDRQHQRVRVSILQRSLASHPSWPDTDVVISRVAAGGRGESETCGLGLAASG